jgi:hypothetical protein
VTFINLGENVANGEVSIPREIILYVPDGTSEISRHIVQGDRI